VLDISEGSRLMRADRRAAEQMFGSTERDDTLFKELLPFSIDVDYGYDATMRSIEDSYQRLGMAEIDVVYVHDLGADHLGDAWEEQFEVAMTGCFRALASLRDQGVIKAWGLGTNVVATCIRALERTDLDVIEISGRYSLIDQSALDRLFPMSSARGVPVVLGGTYNSDLLAGGPHYDYRDAAAELAAKRDRIAAICERHGVDLRAVALQFCAAHPVVTSIIPGSKSPAKVRQNAEFMTIQVPRDVWAELKSEAFIREDAPVP